MNNKNAKSFRDEAMVLSTKKIGEADRIITLLSSRHGKIRAVAKGVRRTTSRFGARLEPFNLVDLLIFRGKSLDVISQVETIAPYARLLMNDYPLYTNAKVMVETADKLTPVEQESAPELYILLVGAVNALARRRYDSQLVLCSYLLRALSTAGWAPSLYDCAMCGKSGPHPTFSVAQGGCICEDCSGSGAKRASVFAISLLRDLMVGNWDMVQTSATHVREEANELAVAYTQWHLDRRLHSLALVEHSADKQ